MENKDNDFEKDIRKQIEITISNYKMNNNVMEFMKRVQEFIKSEYIYNKFDNDVNRALYEKIIDKYEKLDLESTIGKYEILEEMGNISDSAFYIYYQNAKDLAEIIYEDVMADTVETFLDNDGFELYCTPSDSYGDILDAYRLSTGLAIANGQFKLEKIVDDYDLDIDLDEMDKDELLTLASAFEEEYQLGDYFQKEQELESESEIEK